MERMILESVDFPETEKVFDWTSLLDDAAFSIFSRLSFRDRVSLSSTCRSLRAVGWLQALDLRPKHCDAKAASSLASHCQQLKRLWISGVCEVDANTISAFADNCKNLTDIGFIDCGKVDETALGNVMSVRFISVAGTTDLNWNLVVQHWSKLPCLIGLDVSRTDIPSDTFLGFFSYSFSLKVLCALNCPKLHGDATFVSNDYYKGTVLVSIFTDILKSVAVCCNNCKKDSEMSNWLERIISSSLLRDSECNPGGLGFNQGTDLLYSFLQSANEEVQERAFTALANYSTCDDEFPYSGDGIRLLLNLAQSWQEGLQMKTAKVIAKLSVNVTVAKAVLDEGGISFLANLATSANRSVAEEAIGALVQLIYIHHDGVRAEAVSLLWDLCCDDRNQEVFAEAGGVEALVALAKSSLKAPHEFQLTAAGAAVLSELSRSEAYSLAICQEGGVAPLIALAESDDRDVRVCAVVALWRIASYPINAIRIIEESGIDTIARLSSSCCYPKVTRLFSALALTCMFDQRMDDIVRKGGTYTNSVELERARIIATKHIEAFVRTISDPQFACIRKAGQLLLSEAEIGRFVVMLQNPCRAAVKSCVAYALDQYGADHVSFLKNAGAQSVLQQAAVAEDEEDELPETKIFARLVLRNMEWFSYLESR